jgi:hypothetical protein
MWLRFDATTLWHFDAAEWAPSTTSFAAGLFSLGADVCPLLVGGLNRSTQHFILGEKMECENGTGISSRVYGGREDGVMGPLAAWRVAQGDWAGFLQAVLIDLQPGGTAWRHSSSCSASLAVGTDAFGA